MPDQASKIMLNSYEALTLIILLIAALALMFYLVFRWMQRAEQAGYLGRLYKDAVFQIEKTRLYQPVEQKRSQRGYEQDAILENPWNKEAPKISSQLGQLILAYQRKTGDRGAGWSAAGFRHSDRGSGSGIGNLLPGTFETDEPELPYLSVEVDGDAQPPASEGDICEGRKGLIRGKSFAISH